MVGMTVNRDPDGVTIYKEDKEMFLDKLEAARLAETVQEARRRYWKRFRLQPLKEQTLKVADGALESRGKI